VYRQELFESSLENPYYNKKIKQRILQTDGNTNDTDAPVKPDIDSQSNNNFDPTLIREPERSTRWKSNITLIERQKYVRMLNLKKSFTVTLTFLPPSFNPGKSTYYKQVTKIVVGFLIVSSIISLLIIFYLISRFWCKKCIGPKKSQVKRGYRNSTWILLSKHKY
jgi:uncharacterized membrane protein